MKNKVKKVISAILVFSCFLTALPAGITQSKKSSKKLNGSAEKKSEVFQIVCTSFPQYDWVINILGNEKSADKKFEVTLLQNNGTDMHSFQPSVKDIANTPATIVAQKPLIIADVVDILSIMFCIICRYWIGLSSNLSLSPILCLLLF